ncbi:MAG: hypothetical protein K9M44_01730 [Candidatus Pacebacteria bacterium]|nr:hypothetical protein [Candidatus Paceibacterota bacterium]
MNFEKNFNQPSNKNEDKEDKEQREKNNEKLASELAEKSSSDILDIQEKMDAYNNDPERIKREEDELEAGEALMRKLYRRWSDGNDTRCGAYVSDKELGSLKTMKPEWAKMITGKVWATDGVRYNLMGVSEMSDECIDIFAKSNQSLMLGVEKVTKNSAESLSQCRAELTLDKVKELSTEEAVSLFEADRDQYESSTRKRRGTDLNGLKQISPEVAKAMVRDQGYLQLGIEELTEELADILSKHEGEELSFSNLKKLEPEVAKRLAQYRGKLEIYVQEPIDDQTAKNLARKIEGQDQYNASVRVRDGKHQPWYEKDNERKISYESSEKMWKSRRNFFQRILNRS